MPEDLRQKIIEAIAKSAREDFKEVMMLLLRVEEIFIERVDLLAAQMTVPAQQHTEDHEWVQGARRAGRNMRLTASRAAFHIGERLVWVILGVLALKLFGVSL